MFYDLPESIEDGISVLELAIRFEFTSVLVRPILLGADEVS
jgi:hypothetical protein